MTTKQCTRCREIKPLDSFCRRSASADGLASICRDCAKAKRAAYYQTENGHAKREQYREKYRGKYALKVKAQSMIRHDIRVGKVSRKPCEICGDVKSHAHHDDYSKPLDVRWLCAKHHAEWHRGNSAMPATEITPRKRGRAGDAKLYGVQRHRAGRYQARYRKQYLGTFENPQAASRAVQEAIRKERAASTARNGFAHAETAE